MGVSTNAILAFGFDLGEELPDAFTADEDEYFDWWEWICKHLGIEDEDYAVRQAAIKAFPMDMITYCSNEYPMYFIAVSGTKQTTRRGDVDEVEFTSVSADEIQALREFCDKTGIEWQEPRWRLMSYWG